MKSVIVKTKDIGNGEYEITARLDGNNFLVRGSWTSCVRQIEEEEKYERYTLSDIGNQLVRNVMA